MKFRIAIMFSILFALGTAQAEINMGLGVMGFQAWKASRIEEAKTQIDRLQGELGADKAQGDRAPGEKNPVMKSLDGKPIAKDRLQKTPRADQRLSQAQLNLEIAQELSVNDYFVLYLGRFKERAAFQEAARKLSVDEAADLMIAYQRSIDLNSSAEAGLPTAMIPAEGKTARP
ncbi:MAG: hypothetical protein AAB250_05170 [Bdellovibrionota bacterium]